MCMFRQAAAVFQAARGKSLQHDLNCVDELIAMGFGSNNTRCFNGFCTASMRQAQACIQDTTVLLATHWLPPSGKDSSPITTLASTAVTHCYISCASFNLTLKEWKAESICWLKEQNPNPLE